MQEEDDNMTEIANSIFSDLLSENPDQAVSAFGPHRVVPDRWKGMSEEQLKRIREEQMRQVEEKKVNLTTLTNLVFVFKVTLFYLFLKRQEEEDRLEREEFDRRRLLEARAGIIAERQIERSIKDLEKQVADENKRIDYEQKQHKNYLNRVVYTNQPTAAYFMQFNTSTR